MQILFLAAFLLFSSFLASASEAPLITDAQVAERIRLPAGFRA